LGVGTTITLYLPRPDDGARRDDDAPPESADVPPGTRVLLVEDDAEVRRVAQTFLEALGCTVRCCIDAEQALPLLVPGDGGALPCDMLLSDIALGAGMRGTELAAEAARRLPRLPILLMSGYSSGVLDRPPPWELLHKPFTRSQLARAIVRVLKAG